MRTAFEIDKSVYRIPRPTTLWDICDIKTEGFRTVLDLQSRQNKQITLGLLQVNVLAIELNLCPFWPPSRAYLDAGLEILLRSELHPIGFHCRKSVDRTGMLAAWYRIQVQKWSKEKAVEEMYRLGMSWQCRWWAMAL